MNVNQGKARSDMTVEERIAAADRRKIEGNGYFKEQKFEEAMQQYEMVSGKLYFAHDYTSSYQHILISVELFPFTGDCIHGR